ncbi:hypothetical protein Tco_0005870 [Tanacetum coccineum]
MQKRSETETKSSRRGHTKGVKKTQTVKVIPLKEKEAVKAHTKSRTKRYAKSVGRRRRIRLSANKRVMIPEKKLPGAIVAFRAKRKQKREEGRNRKKERGNEG